MLQPVGSQRAGHDLVTEQQQQHKQGPERVSSHKDYVTDDISVHMYTWKLWKQTLSLANCRHSAFRSHAAPPPSVCYWLQASDRGQDPLQTQGEMNQTPSPGGRVARPRCRRTGRVRHMWHPFWCKTFWKGTVET